MASSFARPATPQAFALALMWVLTWAAPASAGATHQFNIPPGNLATALREFAEQSGKDVLYSSEMVRSARSPGFLGADSAEGALARILYRTDFTFVVADAGTLLIRAHPRSLSDRSAKSEASEPR